MFGRKKKAAQAPAGPGVLTYDLRTGATFEAITSPELAKRAVAEGTLAWVYIIDPMFNGSVDRVNQLPAPPAVQGALHTMNARLVEAIQSGADVGLGFHAEYRGDSAVPATMTYDTGAAGVHQILIW